MASDDQCKCVRTCFPNGCCQVLLVQSLLFCGFIFSLSTLIDCRFIVTDLSQPSKIDYQDPPGFLPQNEKQGYGFFWFENPSDGKCWWDFWGTESSDAQADFEDYYKFFDEVWRVALGFGAISACMSLCFWVYSLCLTCLSHKKVFRHMLGSALIFLLVPCQGITFAVFASEFCNAYQCSFQQSTTFSVLALLCFFLTGSVFLFFMSDYPGGLIDKKEEKKTKEVRDEKMEKDEEAAAAEENQEKAPEEVAANEETIGENNLEEDVAERELDNEEAVVAFVAQDELQSTERNNEEIVNEDQSPCETMQASESIEETVPEEALSSPAQDEELYPQHHESPPQEEEPSAQEEDSSAQEEEPSAQEEEPFVHE